MLSASTNPWIWWSWLLDVVVIPQSMLFFFWVIFMVVKEHFTVIERDLDRENFTINHWVWGELCQYIQMLCTSDLGVLEQQAILKAVLKRLYGWGFGDGGL